jgi:predicted ABC-type ATPase
MKRLFIIRGLPGSGKSTLAIVLAPMHSVAADDFMVDSQGNYLHDHTRLKECHAKCLARAIEWMTNHIASVAVHNTFSKRWEMAPYVDAAKLHGYEVLLSKRKTISVTSTGSPRPPWKE